MPHVIDLRKKPPEPEMKAPVQPPAVPQKAPLPPEVVRHPAFEQNQILRETGGVLPYQTMKWTAPQSSRQQGNIAPYMLAGILVVVGILFAIFQGDITTPVLFGLLAIMLVVHVRRAIGMVTVEVSPLSIKLDDKTYKYDDIKSFWLHYEPDQNIRELSVQLKKWYQPYLKIQILDQDPVQIRAILLEFIPEEEHKEMLIHTIVRRLGL